MKNLFYCLIFFCINFYSVQGQNFTISGIVDDVTTGELLLSAYIYDSISYKGTSSNYYGFYSLTLPGGKVRIVCSYVGYEVQIIEFELKKDTTIHFSLNPIKMLEEVIVTSTRRNIARSMQMGMVELSTRQIKQLPVFMGEADIMKTIQLLPGVKGGTEGTSGIYVRGGGPDQNLILLDGVPVYNANHIFGFFSVFNSDAIQSISLLKGGFPARYGGRLSSVMDIKMKEGNNKKLAGNISIGLISSKITLEGPIKNENTSFLISARRTYIDLFLNVIGMLKGSDDRVGYYFYDLNAKINHKLSDRSRIFYSFYKGLDKFYTIIKDDFESGKAGSGWGNDIHALRWNYVLSDNLFSNLTATYSNYNFFIEMGNTEKNTNNFLAIEYNSGIRDIGFKADFDYIPTTSHYIRFGTAFTYHRFNPGVNIFKINFSDAEYEQKVDTTLGNFAVYAHENVFFIEDEIEITDRLKWNIGFYLSVFTVKNKNYFSAQPRLTCRYLLTDRLSLKASVVQMKQYVQLLTTANIGLPSDLWVPSTDKVPPMEAWQYSVGIAYSPNGNYELTIEGYYKPMKNIIEYKEGASFISINNSWENKVEIGKGWGKGIELMIHKKTGKINGWIGYTLSYSDRQFENISFGQKFPYKYDRRHDIGVAMNYHKSDRFDFGLTWVYGTGLAVTLPTTQYIDPVTLFNSHYNSSMSESFYAYVPTIEYFPKRNNYRMPAYHRLDLAFNYHYPLKRAISSLSIGVYNAYMRQNPIFIDFATVYENDKPKRVLKQYSLFRLVPFISYNITF